MRRFLRRFLDEDRGDGIAEYAILIALIAICLIAVVQTLGNAVGNTFNTTKSGVAQTSASSYGSAPRLRVVSGPSYGGSAGGGGGGAGGGTSAGPGDEGTPSPDPDPDGGGDDQPADSLGVDSLGVSSY